MLLKEFPDINWIRRQSKNNFADGVAYNGSKIKSSGWPTVILNTQSFATERTNITAPFTIFMNLKGQSMVRIDKQSIPLSKNTFCLVQPGETYDLVIPDSEESTETFNVHFGQQFYDDAMNTLLRDNRYLIDNIESQKVNYPFPTNSFWKDERTRSLVLTLKQFYRNNIKSKLTEEELLFALFEQALSFRDKSFQQIEKFDALKVSTRNEILRRLQTAITFIHQHYNDEINLDEVASVAMLSKFHFLRTFKLAFGISPRQYIVHIRLKKSQELLKSTSLNVSQISTIIGYQEPNSFTRAFSNAFGISPMQYRNN